MGHAKSVRMSDVARLARVSAMTVSRALRAPDTVSEDTRERIRDAIEKTGYIPNRLAGNLSSRHSDVIGLIVPSLRNSLFAETIQAIADNLGKAGFHVLIAESGHSLEVEETLVLAFLSQQVSGIILHNTAHTPRIRAILTKADIPVIETGDLTRDPIDIVVSYSNFEAAKAMTHHLHRRGYRRIAFVSLATETNDRMRQRRSGYLAALEELDLKQDRQLILETPEGLSGGRDALVRLLDLKKRPDAIFCAGDVLAVGAALECQRRNLRLPEDVAIASFDDLDILDHLVPRITALRLPRREIGLFSASILLQRILKLGGGVIAKDLGFDIIQREST
ncbi:MAG: LacI family DNA-binding transcriptional regulator [Alphaproteobacteria bacterium]|nr:LacI family DNA-binding transcriptional regulator [Alphaproteobacteria bacterium]MBU0886804.1 LacI family DNA-binding transcriptional regulator [Alphaproteobacteria bacterium]MBU1812454.1 LacI family DNA-binding transcriptional regulator [Alphaproteobacteria bacterium]MBU2089594.1 LacI family DNA-binding transcriptional regulator [Alphaproteobacteria bacterium]